MDTSLWEDYIGCVVVSIYHYRKWKFSEEIIILIDHEDSLSTNYKSNSVI